MTKNTWRVAALLFGSGLCALIYQTVWLRQFRLIFGASTFATGAVLAIFMGGLGLGSAILGKRADARERPLLFYGNLEVLIAIAAALSQPLLWLAGKAYFASGGSPQLGILGATLLRLALALLVLGPATFLMGATLPAAARAVATTDDSGRRAVALLYGVNTLGAVAGALLSTFALLETYGNRATLAMAVLLNVIVGMIARNLGKENLVRVEDATEVAVEQRDSRAMPVYIASLLVGFAFLLMELVWYRMLSPILGGTTYMFGLILAVALFGIGVGGGLYAMIRTRPTAGAFAITCSLEALAVAIPLALGDRLAILANVLRDLGAFGFTGHVTAWTLMTAIVAFPAACVAGYQFPLLIALLGRGRENVGRQIGAAYAWNTAGAIAGSLAGGFGILPLLSAPGTWRLVAFLLTALAAAALLFALRDGNRLQAAVTVVTGALAILCTTATGPTAVWRHSAIGIGLAPRERAANELHGWMLNTRQNLMWDEDGRESSVGVLAANDLAFFINGKSDGTARLDGETQVMSGLLGAILHPNPQHSLVVGLGSGSTSGWLAQVPTMQRVDTIELEPVLLDVARACAPVNAGAMSNPKVKITIADAREVLLTSDEKYDLIASEPSNPYRAGVASLFTRDFYEAVDARLAPGGYLIQWIQAYAVHPATMRTIYATLTTVFPQVQTWATSDGDLMLVASREPIRVDANTLRARIASEPYRSALHHVWRTENIEQFFGHLLANETFARAAAEAAEEINTDDRPTIEFGFARSLDPTINLLGQLSADADRLQQNRPVAFTGNVDWATADANRPHRIALSPTPLNMAQMSARALEMVERDDPNAQPYIDFVAKREPLEAAVIMATQRFRQQKFDESAALLQRAFAGYHSTPWPHPRVMQRGIGIAMDVGATSPQRARQMFGALARPFPVMLQDNYRRFALARLAPMFDGCGSRTIAVFRSLEPNPIWTEEMLTVRAQCYGRANLGDLADEAAEDLDRFRSAAATPVVTRLTNPAPRGSS